MVLSLVVNNVGAKTRSTGRQCGQCENYQHDDCVVCKNCKDKPHNGGPGRLKQSCITRKCLRLGTQKSFNAAELQN